jgi:hypothetical protein
MPSAISLKHRPGWPEIRTKARRGSPHAYGERALRGSVLGRKNYLFAGSDAGGERAAAMYSQLETAKLNGIDPEAYLRHVLARLPDHPIKVTGSYEAFLSGAAGSCNGERSGFAS